MPQLALRSLLPIPSCGHLSRLPVATLGSSCRLLVADSCLGTRPVQLGRVCKAGGGALGLQVHDDVVLVFGIVVEQENRERHIPCPRC